MEGNRQRRKTREPLNPELWSNLPRELNDQIILRVLTDLPFSKLHSFCIVCKRWRDHLLSKNHYLLFLHMGKLNAFNSRRGTWEQISLRFCIAQVQGLRLQNLRLLFSGGGLLCLANIANGEYIVCNPVTKCCKRLGKCQWQWRPKNSLPVSYETKLGTRVVAYSTWPAGNGFQDVDQQILTIYQWSIKGDIQLMLSIDQIPATHQRRTIVHDYRRTSRPAWELVVGVQDGFYFYGDGPIMLSGVLLALGFHRAARSAGFNVLVYDLKLRQCGWILTPQIPRCTEKQLVGTIGVANQFQFEEIRDTGHTAAFPPPLRNAFEDLMPRMSRRHRSAVTARKFFGMVYVEQDDVGYLVAMVADASKGPYSVFAVWRHCRVDNSDVISEWKEDWTCNLGQWPDVQTSFHAFKPTFACPNGT